MGTARNGNSDDPANQGKQGQGTELLAFRTLFWVCVVVVGCCLIAGSLAWAFGHESPDPLDIIACVEPNDSTQACDSKPAVEARLEDKSHPGSDSEPTDVRWRVFGRVVERKTMRPVAASVTVVVRDEATGNRVSDEMTSDGQGAFSFDIRQPGALSFDTPTGSTSTDGQTQPGENGGALSFVVTAVRPGSERIAEGSKRETLAAARGREEIRVGQGLGLQDFDERWPFIFALVLFPLSMMLAMTRGWKQYHPVKLYSALLLALFFSGSLVFGFTWTVRQIAKQPRDKVISLGFAHLFFGGYGNDKSNPEWMFSFTQPQPDRRRPHGSQDSPWPIARNRPDGTRDAGPNCDTAPDAASKPRGAPIADDKPKGKPATGNNEGNDGSARNRWFKDWRDRRTQLRREGIWSEQGFGAPVWVLLLAVLGSSLYTVRLIVDCLKTRDPAKNEAPATQEKLVVGSSLHTVTLTVDCLKQEDSTSGTLKDIIQHQLFTLVSPLTAIFVYQAMVATKMHTGVLPVALAALASGLALTALLTKAMQSLPNWTRKPSDGKNREPGHLTPPPAAR